MTTREIEVGSQFLGEIDFSEKLGESRSVFKLF